jgi:rubrerythrin
MPSSRSSSEGLTRGSFILRGALATAAAYGAGAVTPFVRAALAQSDASDAQILDFALRLETLELTFYDQALTQLPALAGPVRSVAREIRDHEHEHQRILTDTLGQLGIRTSPTPKFNFGDAFSSQSRFLAVSQSLEDTGVAAYNGAAPMVFDPHLLEVVGQIVQIEARHAAVVADLRGQPIAPGAFERGLKIDEVAQRVKPYVVG